MDRQDIIDLYKSGLTYREIKQTTGRSRNFIGKTIRKYFANRWNYSGLDQQQEIIDHLSECAKKAARNNRKFWTKPERLFAQILKSIGLGVRYPIFIKDLFGLVDDSGASIFFQLPIQRYVVDFAEPAKMIVYRVNGDFWHANPLLYSSNKLTIIQRHNLRQDKNCKEYLNKKGWLVVDIWESEIYWNQTLVQSRIKAARVDRIDGNTQLDIESIEWQKRLNDLWFASKHRKKNITIIKCQQCEKCIHVSADNKKQINRKFCSASCACLFRRRCSHPARAELETDIANMNWSSIGRKYGVTDNAVRKWARKYNLL